MGIAQRISKLEREHARYQEHDGMCECTPQACEVVFESEAPGGVSASDKPIKVCTKCGGDAKRVVVSFVNLLVQHDSEEADGQDDGSSGDADTGETPREGWGVGGTEMAGGGYGDA